ncbi:MAG: hypothetical protein Q8904_08660 [Bacteroidota bacterium]|nr:hypothetical protein [Bacteroidota bacterium]
MKKIIIYCFDKWWHPVLFCVLTIGLLAISVFIPQELIQTIFLCLFFIGFLGLLFSIIYQLAKARWGAVIYTTGIIVISMICFMYYIGAMFWKIQDKPDTYADKLKIPTNIQIHQPNEQTKLDKTKETDFFIYASSQPGIYTYAVWTRKIEKGMTYLKAFEVTKNDPLSVDKLKERSIIEVNNPTDSIVKFGMKNNKEFIIDEGDWRKPYAARFELWFKPDNGGMERKLLEKNYKIHGWQR